VSGFQPGNYTFECFPGGNFGLFGTISVDASGNGSAYTRNTSFCEAVNGGQATVGIGTVTGSGSGYW
jgi:hypothetical protein